MIELDENLKKIKALTSNIDFSGNNTDEYLFTINCVDYFYFGGNIGKVDIIDGFTDGANDGGIDFIYTDSENVIHLIQGKSQKDLTYDDIRDLFYKIREAVLNFKKGEIDQYNKKLKDIFQNALDNGDNPDIELVLFTNTMIEEDLLDKIKKEIVDSEDFANYKVVVYSAEDIAYQVLKVDQKPMEISEAALLLDGTKNSLSYQEGKGAIFSIRAVSLKKLFEKYADKGLFGYNLREHVAQKNVDDAIDKTIKEDRENFWFYNNGITIGCKDYKPDGNELKIYNFSIINGAQTTTKIGESKFIDDNHDFSLVCKVIKSEGSLGDEFIRKISEASNSQKPIKFRDLKSNAPEQQLLQSKFMELNNPLSVEIKRGVKPKNYRRVNSWERISNEYLGQIILSCQYQMPGTARSKTSDIFGKEETYNLIFSKDRVKKYNYETLYEMVNFGHLYDDFKVDYDEELNRQIKLTDNETIKIDLNNKDGICRNGKYVILSIIFYLYKKKCLDMADKPFSKIKNTVIYDNLILSSADDFEDRCRKLFEFIIDRLNYIYNTYKFSMKLTSYSNFFKSDKNFEDVIIPEIDKTYNDPYFNSGLLKMLTIFEDE